MVECLLDGLGLVIEVVVGPAFDDDEFLVLGRCAAGLKVDQYTAIIDAVGA
ncbi:hypothetical protein GCM10009648_45020 [Tsukamurella spumae]